MVDIDNTQKMVLHQPYAISKAVFTAISPLDQLAAKALEKCGQVRIVEENGQDLAGWTR
jgi:hypothetical protein